MKENIAQIIKTTVNGSRCIRVTLDPESTSILEQLLELEEGLIIQLSETDLKALTDIVTSTSGFGQKHPTIIIITTERFDADSFIENIGPAIESIKAI